MNQEIHDLGKAFDTVKHMIIIKTLEILETEVHRSFLFCD